MAFQLLGSGINLGEGFGAPALFTAREPQGHLALALQFIPLVILDPDEGLLCGFRDSVSPSPVGGSPIITHSQRV